MNKSKTLTAIFVTLLLALALIENTTAQRSDDMQTFFSKDYPGISIMVNGTQEAIPGENITIDLWVNCTADGVKVDYLNISVYGYSHFRYGLEKITLNFACVINNSSLVYHNVSEQDYSIAIPDDVWDQTYAEIYLKYGIKASPPYEYDEIFPITTVRNTLWEELDKTITSLNESNQQLNNTLEQLDQLFWESFQINLSAENLAYLNKTYWELQQNYTSLKGNLGELEGTRQAVIVLAITSVFFVATTVYLITRKPKQYY
jgi:hypothetical protein